MTNTNLNPEPGNDNRQRESMADLHRKHLAELDAEASVLRLVLADTSPEEETRYRPPSKRDQRLGALADAKCQAKAAGILLLDTWVEMMAGREWRAHLTAARRRLDNVVTHIEEAEGHEVKKPQPRKPCEPCGNEYGSHDPKDPCVQTPTMPDVGTE